MFYKSNRSVEKYEQEKKSVTARIIKRQSRGNVRVQNGNSDTYKKFKEMSVKADQQLAILLKAIPQI